MARSSPSCRPLVRTRGDSRSLEFRTGMIQSEMSLAQPYKLVLGYARAMMCFTLFNPAPRRVLMVGLGGGSLAKFCHRHLPDCDITVLELRADVIALRDQFLIPPDDARFRIVQANAVDYIAGHPRCADVLLIDGFDDIGMPPALGSARFYLDCRRALAPNGILVANLFNYDRHYGAMVRRLRSAFGGHLCWFDGIAGNNSILFAVNCADAQGAARAVRVQRLVAWRQGLGWQRLNRLLAQTVVWWLSRAAGSAAA